MLRLLKAFRLCAFSVFALALGCLSGLGIIGSAMAQVENEYPNRPIRLIVAYAPGGGTDITARLIAPKLAEALGKQVIVDNRPGAGSTIGTDIVAKATPDGYTLLLSETTLSIAPALYEKLNYDAVRDFSPISQLASVPMALVIYPGFQVNSVKDLVALARSKPNELTFGSGGVGAPPHMSGELLKLAAKISMVHVPYKGSGPAMTALMGGQFQMMFPTLTQAVPYIKSGRVRVLAVTGERRSHALPKVPTMGEAGFPDVVSVAWFGLHAPASTPRPIIAKLNAEAIRVLQDPVIKDRFAKDGTETVGSSPEQFAKFISDEIAKWNKVVKEGGIKVEF